jgi:hypothetical protein
VSGWHRVEVFERVPAEVATAAEEQAVERCWQAGLAALAQPGRMLGAIFAFTTDRAVLLAEVDAAELGAMANLRPARVRAVLDRLIDARAVYVRHQGDCCLLLGVPPEGYFWRDGPRPLDVDLLELVRERREAS